MDAPPAGPGFLSSGAAVLTSVRGRGAHIRLVLLEASKTALTEFRIGNRTAFLALTRLAELTVRFKTAIVAFALDHILPRRTRLWHIALASLRGIALRAVVARCGAVSTCHLGLGWPRRDRRQASSSECDTHYCFERVMTVAPGVESARAWINQR